LEGGYLAEVKLNVVSELDAEGVTVTLGMETALTRTPGNPLNITPPPPRTGPGSGPPPGPIARGRVLLNLTSQLTAQDQPDVRGKPGCRCKTWQLKLAAGKQYVIEMNQTPGTQVDPYLRVEDPAGRTLAFDDDSGGGLNARIVFAPPR